MMTTVNLVKQEPVFLADTNGLKRPETGLSMTATIQDVFIIRANRIIQEMASILAAGELRQIVAESTDYNALLRAMEKSLPRLQSTDPLASDRIEGLRALERLFQDSGPMLSAVEAGQMLGISRQAIHGKRKKKELLAIKRGRSYLYPAWQFQEGKVMEGVAGVLGVFEDSSPWTILRFFLSHSPFLQNDTPLERLQGKDADAVLQAAIAHGAHGAS